MRRLFSTSLLIIIVLYSFSQKTLNNYFKHNGFSIEAIYERNLNLSPQFTIHKYRSYYGIGPIFGPNTIGFTNNEITSYGLRGTKFNYQYLLYHFNTLFEIYVNYNFNNLFYFNPAREYSIDYGGWIERSTIFSNTLGLGYKFNFIANCYLNLDFSVGYAYERLRFRSVGNLYYFKNEIHNTYVIKFGFGHFF